MNDMAVSYAHHRFTVDEYHRMVDADVLDSDARIELIDGELIETLVTMKPPHAKVVRYLNKMLTLRLGDRAILGCQVPVTLGDLSEPEPDFSILRLPASRYGGRHPGPAEILCLIEVSDSSRALDLRKKVPLYARFAVPEVLVVDLVDSIVRVFRDASDEGFFHENTVATAGDTIALLEFPDVVLRVRDIFE